MKKLILFLLISCLTLQGCIPALIIGGVMAHNSSKKSRSQWNSEFNKNNTERQEHHLQPLDYCEEAAKVNLGWVDQDCKTKLVKEGKLKPLKRNNNASH